MSSSVTLTIKKRAPAGPRPSAAPTDVILKGAQKVALGAVYIPGVLDSHGDWATDEVIRKAAYDLMQRQETHVIDVMHEGELVNAYIVESFIVRKGDPDFKVPGTWVVGVHIPDASLWEKVVKGELNAFSLEGQATTVRDREPEVYIAKAAGDVSGATGPSQDHTHTFRVVFDSAGRILSGETDTHTDPLTGESHSHRITKSTRTDIELGHRHRYSVLDGLLELVHAP